MLTTEPNYLRKSHRVTLPLLVSIDGQSYRARDWSLTGVGIQGFTKELRPDEILDAVLSLPMAESQLNLKVQLSFKRRHGEVTGFEFHELSPRNRRILRHYVELAVEGRLDNVEDLIAVVTAPEIATPIQDALNLSDLEEENLVSRFRSRTRLSLFLALLFFLLILATLFYNTTYRISATGVVTGNLRKVSAGVNGMVTRVMASPGQPVEKGEPLLLIRDEGYEEEVAALEQRRLHLQRQLAAVSPNDSAPGTLLKELKAMVARRSEELDRARKLREEHLITSKDLAQIENLYRQALLNLAREEQKLGDTSGTDGPEATLLRRHLRELEQRLARLARQGGVHEVASPASGLLFNLSVEMGQRVAAGTTVSLIQDDQTPFVLIRLLNEDAIKLQPAMKANVVVPFLDREYPATVDAIGYNAVNAEVTLSQEASLNETLVKLVFDDPSVRLPANLRVKVWIRTFDWRRRFL